MGLLKMGLIKCVINKFIDYKFNKAIKLSGCLKLNVVLIDGCFLNLVDFINNYG